MNAQTHDVETGCATGWPRMVQLADFLDNLADESERDGLPDNAKRLRGDAAWYRNRFSPKDLK